MMRDAQVIYSPTRGLSAPGQQRLLEAGLVQVTHHVFHDVLHLQKHDKTKLKHLNKLSHVVINQLNYGQPSVMKYCSMCVLL